MGWERGCLVFHSGARKEHGPGVWVGGSFGRVAPLLGRCAGSSGYLLRRVVARSAGFGILLLASNASSVPCPLGLLRVCLTSKCFLHCKTGAIRAPTSGQ